MSENPLNEIFEQRVAKFEKEALHLRKQSQFFSVTRILLFVLFGIAVVYFANAREITGVFSSIAFFVLAFSLIVKKHNQIKFDLKHLESLQEINQTEIKHLDGDTSGLATGSGFFDPNHEYAPDLDVFGSNSLFQKLNRSDLFGSAALLSKWLLNGANKKEIEARQLAIKELQPLIDWRQNFTAFGMHIDEGKQRKNDFVTTLLAWFRENVVIVDKPIWAVLTYLMPLVSAVILLGIPLFGWTYHFIYLPIVCNLIVLKIIYQPLINLAKEFDNISHLLLGYENLISSIEKLKVKSEFLKTQQSKLFSNQTTASGAIKSLRSILNGLQNRANMIYPTFNLFFLLDLIMLRRALHWNKSHQDAIQPWFDSVFHVDVINGQAGYAYINPSFAFPEIIDNEIGFHASQMGHPLIKPGQRITNSCKFADKGKLGLITGSNMSGKSTFLRTVGVNLVLAQMGAPVCASSFQFSLMKIFTSMRTQDNLEENVSSFYAELKRIRKLLDLIGDEAPTYYLLDEILKGTNSEDRNIGAIALIKQLVQSNSIGLISTHDLHLSKLSSDNAQIENYSFNSTIEGDEIIFDYTLTPGPCKNFNASKLMEQMGIIKK